MDTKTVSKFIEIAIASGVGIVVAKKVQIGINNINLSLREKLIVQLKETEKVQTFGK